MPTSNNGQFQIEIGTSELARGLRPSKRVPRNSKFLTICDGAVALDGVLQVLQDLSGDAVDVSALVGVAFPYPQIFVFNKVIIVCSNATIFELVAGSLVAKLTVAVGLTWSAVDFYDYVYMSNGKVAVKRSATSGIWALDTTLPIASGICNYNGQVLVGAPDVEWV